MFLLHRLSGILLFLFLLIHFSTINRLKKDINYEFLHTLKANPFLKVFEYLLIIVVLIHLFLGIRVLLLESEVVSSRNIYLNKIIVGLIVLTALFILIFGNFL